MQNRFNIRNHLRQVHLDFHTSPFIPDVAVDFDAREFAETFRRAHVNSVTVFAKCHHGMCYYPTKTGVTHPALGKRDLLGEQIEALHRAGIRAPIYTTVVWEEVAAAAHPEWRQLTRDGYFAGLSLGPDGKPGHHGMWRFLNFLHPGYQDYFEAHLREVLERYGKEIDGFFIDILFFANGACWSEPCVEFRKKHNLLKDDAPTNALFQGLAQAAFTKKFTRIIHSAVPHATVFYNAQNEGNMNPAIGPRARQAYQTHFEIESLPSGFWGYHHFPRMARAQSTWGKPWVGMTGRFQKMWGDFGGIKPQAALEYECFRSQALGGGNSVGDQLPPRGKLDPAAYELIGAVFKQVADAEPFYQGATFLKERVGILTANFPGYDGGQSEEGVVMLCEEAHYDCVMLDSLSSFEGLTAILLPDSVRVDAGTVKKLRAFYTKGGKLLLSHESGRDFDGKWVLDFLPLSFHGECEKFPTYWRAKKDFDAEMSRSDRVMYSQGLNVLPGKGARVLIDRVLPYFKRSDAHFSSHFQTPPVARADKFAAVVAGKNFVYFADPIFREYRKSANPAVRAVWRRLMRELIGPAPFGDGLPSSVSVYPLRRGTDLLLTLLHYIPVRKSLEIDVIDEPSSFAGEVLRLPSHVRRVVQFPKGDELDRIAPGEFALPPLKGRLLLEVPGYFRSSR